MKEGVSFDWEITERKKPEKIAPLNKDKEK